MQINSGFLLNRLILVGRRKNYVIPFHPGVNIIYGDADTGKSSILRLLYYCFGAKKVEVDYEISSSVLYVVLETQINGTTFCIQRDLFDATKLIEVFECGFDSINENFPTKYAPNLSTTSTVQSISEFLMENLNFPAVSIKQSPSKDDSALSRLSFLDLFKYCYLDQDEVGSKTLLDAGNYVIEAKNREVFKYIFNVLDDQLTEVAAEISLKSQERNELQDRLKIIEQFLIDTEFESLFEIENELELLSERQAILSESLTEINSNILNNTELYGQFKDSLNLIYSSISSKETEKLNALNNVDRFGRLKNDYLVDIEKLKALESANATIAAPGKDHISCPLCETQVAMSSITNNFTISDTDKVTHEVTSLKRRIRDLNELLEENRKVIDTLDKELKVLHSDREIASRFIDEETQSSITPYLSQRDAIIYENAALTEKKEKVRHELKVRNLQSTLSEKVVRLSTSIELLKTKQLALQEQAPSLQEVFTSLEGELDLYLRTVKIKNRTGVSLDRKSYLPRVREKEYRHINSGGLRTIVSIGHLAILQMMNAKNDINLPNLLMIDTVGKYLGKTKAKYQEGTNKKEDESEGIADPQKYKNIYEYLIALSDQFVEHGKHCQIILVDNDVPAEIAKEYKGFVIEHYSSSGEEGTSIGLIDDWDLFLNSASN